MKDLPEILLVEDIAEILGVSVGSARRLVSSGACGPFSRIGRRLLLRRAAFMENLQRKEGQSRVLQPQVATRTPDREFLKRLKGRPQIGQEGAADCAGRTGKSEVECRSASE